MTYPALRRSALACSLTLLTAGPTFAQPATGAVPPPAGGVQPAPQAYRAKDILGAKISIQNNTSIGTVEDIVFTDAGEVEYLVVSNEGKLVSIPWSATAFNVAQKAAVVNITQEQYRVIPTYTVTTYPAFFAPAYRAEVYKHYGVTPGQLRRLDRRLP